MKPTHKQLEEMVTSAWMKSHLRDELAELLADEKTSGGSVLEHKRYILGSLADWAATFLNFDHPSFCTPNNIATLQRSLEADVIKRSMEILEERGYTRED